MHSLLQTKEWATLRQAQGWQAHSFDNISILEKKLPFGKSFLYAPETEYQLLQNTKIYKNTKEIVNNKRTIFFRLEILDKFTSEIDQKLREIGFIKAFEEIQPEWRQIIDISKSEDEILRQMKEKGRYNIRVAERHNIVVEKSYNINDFYNIFIETAKRDGFEIRTKQYFEQFLAIFEPLGFAELLVAKYNGKVISAEIVTYFKDTASYLYGASSNENRNLMAPYLLHFEAIKRAKEKGCKFYDLLAVAPELTDNKQLTTNDKEKNNKYHKNVVSSQLSVVSHKYAGITRFKEQFGGEKVHIAGSYDYVYKPVWYWLFKMAERFRRR